MIIIVIIVVNNNSNNNIIYTNDITYVFAETLEKYSKLSDTRHGSRELELFYLFVPI